MSNAAYDRLWREAMNDLAELLAIEDPTVVSTAEPDSKPLPVVELAPKDAYEHFRSMYVRYLSVYSKLERCYEGFLHPQKRIDVMTVLENVIARLVQLHHAIVKWHPLNPEVAKVSPDKPLPWEYIDFDDKLIELHLQPEALEIPVPQHYREVREKEIRDRDNVMAAFMQRILGVDKVLVELDEAVDTTVAGISFSVEEAIAVLQNVERGRQGKMRAAAWKERRAEEAKAAAALTAPGRGRRGIGAMLSDDDAGASSDEEMDPEDAATDIQRLARGFLARQQVKKARLAELVFVGMRDAPRPRLDALEAAMAESVGLRKIDQAANKEAYYAALAAIKEQVFEDEGAEMRDGMTASRTKWFMDKMHEVKGMSEMPEDLSGYYKERELAALGEQKAEPAEDPKAKGKGGKDKPAAAAAAGKDKKGGGKGKGPAVEEEPEKPPPVTSSTPWTKHTESLLRAYDATWVGRDERANPAQRHDVDLVRELLRPKVSEELRLEVDATLNATIQNLRTLMLGGGDKKKEKKAKGKKKAAKAKGKKKKEKPLPGAKACAGLEMKDYISLLVENRVINSARATATFSSFLGGVNLLGSKYSVSDSASQRHPTLGHWLPADPSMAQIRQALMQYAVLPIGSATVREAVATYCAEFKLCDGRCPRSLLLYGPHGSGKTHCVQAVANALGGLLLNLSAGNMDGKFLEKGGAAKVLHMAFEIAKDAALGPVIIYIDEVEKMLAGGGKKKGAAAGGGEGPARFKKDLITYIKSLDVSHSAIVIGTSSEPWEADLKTLNEGFDKKIYLPCPDYGTRSKVWRNAIGAALAAVPDLETYAGITASALTTVPGAYPVTAADGTTAWGGSSAAPGMSAGVESLLGALPVNSCSVVGESSPVNALLDRLNISSLAAVSNGFTVGSIRRAVRETLTPRRLERIAQRPLQESEFISVLARCPRVFADENDKFRAFTDAVTTLAERRTVKEEDPKAKDKKGGKK